MYEADPRAGVNRVYTKQREGRLSWERWKVVPVCVGRQKNCLNTAGKASEQKGYYAYTYDLARAFWDSQQEEGRVGGVEWTNSRQI